MSNILAPYPYFTDARGNPLEGGRIYIGTAGLDPRTNPVTVYQDEALTIPWAQPIRTVGGYPVYIGAPSNIQTAALEFSLIVANSNGEIVFRDLNVISINAANVTFISPRAGAVPRTAQSKMSDVDSIKDFGAIGNGVADDTAAIQAAVNAAATTSGYLFAPKGTYKMSSAISIPNSLVIEGMGEDTVFQAAVSNINLFLANAGGKIGLQNLRLKSDGTASSSAVGTGLRATTFDSLLLDTVWFDTFGQAGLFVTNTASLRQKIELRNIYASGGQNPGAGSNADILIYGAAKNILLENIRGEASGGTPMAGLINVTQTLANQNISNVQIRGVRADGYGRLAIAIGNENPTSDFQSGKVQISDVRVTNNGWSALKTKNVDFIQVDNFYAENCELSSVELAGNLQGTIFLNGANTTNLSNVTLVNCGTNGVRILGRAVGATTTGVGVAAHTMNGLNVWGAAQPALYVGQLVDELVVNGFVSTDTGGGVQVNSSPGLAAPTNITLNSPIIRRTTGNAAGINIAGLSGLNVGAVTINSPDIQQTGGFGVVANFCDKFTIAGGSVLDSGIGAVNKSGIRVANTTALNIFNMNAVSNQAGATQDYGISLGAGITTATIVGNNLSGNATGGFFGTLPTTLIARNNRSWLTASATVDPASTALGASTSISTITVTGAAVGDAVVARFSNSLAGMVLNAWVSAANTVSYFFTNVAGTNPLDLASGTLSVEVFKS